MSGRSLRETIGLIPVNDSPAAHEYSSTNEHAHFTHSKTDAHAVGYLRMGGPLPR